jgi:ABC-2 type transport system permease protein
MAKLVSRFFIIWSIVRKDLLELARDKLWIYLSVVGLIAYAVFYWTLPGTVDETLAIGIHQKGLDRVLEQYAEEETEGLKIVDFDSTEDLKAAVAGELETDKEISIGIDFPEDFLAKAAAGERTTVRLYADAAAPKEIRNAMTSFVREMAFSIRAAARGESPDEALPVKMPEEETIILGEDRMGSQVPFRERIRPMIAFFVLMVESMALASLIATEVQSRTVTAILVTPVRTSDLLVAKTIFGTVLAFSQAVIILLAIKAFGEGAIMLLTALLLGAIMVTGVGLISGAAGKDFMGTLFYSILFMIPLMIPAFAVLFPGTASTWVRVLPSYGLVQTIMRSTVYAQGWADVLPYVGMVVVWNAIIFGTGLVVLKRRVETL